MAEAVNEFSKKVDDLRERFKGGWAGPRFKIFDLAGQLQASTSAPTEAQARTLETLTTQLTGDIARLNEVATRDLPALREKLRAAGLGAAAIKPIDPPKKVQ